MTNEGKRIEFTINDSAGSTDNVTVAVRSYLASLHLWAAIESARHCRARETSLKRPGGPFTEPTLRALAASSVMSSVAFLECFINEIVQDAAEEAPGRQTELLTPRCRDMMKGYWLAGERDSIMTKYQRALTFAGQPEIDENDDALRNARLLVRFRNELMHYKPSWHSDGAPMNLETQMVGRVPRNSLLASDAIAGWVVWALASPGADWAVETARTFADAWVRRMGLERVYEVEVDLFAQESSGDVR